MVLLTPEFIFYAVHKNASQSITEALMRAPMVARRVLYGAIGCTIAGRERYGSVVDNSHAFHTHRAYAARDFHSSLPQKIFRFTFVRNPYARFVTIWKYCRQQGWFRGSMSELVDCIRGLRGKKVNQMTRDQQWIAAHSMPQHYYSCIDGTPEVDFVGRFEQMQEDWTHVKTELEKRGVHKLPARIGKLNATRGKERCWREILTEQGIVLIEKVYELYREDFEIFGYQKTSV